MVSNIINSKKNMVIITKTWSLVPQERWCKKKLTMENVVVVVRNMVVTSLVSTTTYCSVVAKLTTGNIMWSLIVLTTELLMTIDDHNFVVINNF